MVITFTCVHVGEKYSTKDVQRLFNSIKTKYKHTFRVCDEDLLPTYWNKVNYFGPLIEPFETELVIAFDIDILIKESLDELVEWSMDTINDLPHFVWCRWRENYPGQETLSNSSIIAWKPEQVQREIFNKFETRHLEDPGFDYYLVRKNIEHGFIPENFYYSAFFEDWRELDYPIVLFNQCDDKSKIPLKAPWTKNYGF